MKLIFRYPDTGEIHEHDTKGVSVEAIFRREARFIDANFAFRDDVADLTLTFQLVTIEVKKLLPYEWCDQLGILIMDRDGWNEKEWFQPCSRAEFNRRIAKCTIKQPIAKEDDR